jgi:hypothetical protein
MEALNRVLKEIHFAPATYKNEKLERPWADKPVIDGSYSNKIVDKMVSMMGLDVINTDDLQPSISYDTINMPHKSYFKSESLYYQVLLHEASHHMSTLLRQSNDAENAATEYMRTFKEIPPSLNELYQKYSNKESFDNAHSAVKTYLLEGIKDELKIEAAAVAMLPEAGYKIGKENILACANTAIAAERVSGFIGRNFCKEISDDPAYKSEVNTIYSEMKTMALEASKELKNELDTSKQNTPKDKGMDR